MKEEWTGNLVGKMHNAGITLEELGNELGYGKSYVSMILNCARTPVGAQQKLEGAFEAVLARKMANSETTQT